MEEFLATHEPQLKSINFPTSHYADLYQRLHNLDAEVKTMEHAFEIRTFPNSSRSMLISKKDHKVGETFYFIDHIWKSDGGKVAYERLEKTPQLTEKLSTLFSVPPPVDPVTSFDFTREIDLLGSTCEGYSKTEVENQLKECDYDTIATFQKLLDKDKSQDDAEKTNVVSKKESKKKKCTFEEFKEELQYSGHTSGNENDAYMEKMYNNFLLGAQGHGNTLHYNWSDDGDTLTVFVSIPTTAHKQAISSTLTINSWKLVVNGVQLVKGDFYAPIKADESYWNIESPGVLCMTLEKVSVTNLWPELIKGEVTLSQDTIFSTSFIKANSTFLYFNELMERMWAYNQTYSVMAEGGVKQPIWYIMDDYGCALTHAADPSFQCSPFFNIQSGETFNLLWPLKDIASGSACTRNFIPHVVPGEKMEISRIRLKAFTGRKVYQKVEAKVDETFSDSDLQVEIEHQKKSTSNKARPTAVFSDVYGKSISEDVWAKNNLRLVENGKVSEISEADIALLSLDEVSLSVDGDYLPANEVIINKSFLQSYVKLNFEKSPWFQKSLILPRDLELFCQEVERNDIPYMWIVRQVDKRQVHVPIIVTSSYSRIVRMCDAAPVAVSKYIMLQPQFRHRRFLLNYSVIVNKTRNSVFVHKEPLIHQSKGDYKPNNFMNEYDSSNDILSGRRDALVGSQDVETYKDLKSAMTKLLLPRDENETWEVYQDGIHKRVGALAKSMLKDMSVESCTKEGGQSCVLFGVDVIIDSNLSPVIIDVNGICTPATKQCLEDILMLCTGNINENFVQVK